MTRIAQIFAACVVLGLAGLSTAENSPADSTTQPSAASGPTTRISLQQLNHLQSELKDVATVEADFVEQKTLAMLNHTLTIRGHFALQKPDRLIWIVREPVRYAIRIEGDEVQQWDEDTNRVDVIHLGGDPTFKAVSEQIQAWFLGDYKALSKSYEVDVLSENPLSLRFVPQTDSMMGKAMTRIDIVFAQDERYIEKMVMNETGGNVTVLTFVHTQVNQPIKDEIWRMPPNER
ncbi:MAG TPA: outer membrane lipoprotein carrier protein LolA [Tepidisphaeraceae bacterium]|jgi:outer membrane lipoprotein-sorting protein|nr:outer membrane lipoprotein carrier protein LolA [Tepidisphaeraceae bacterium]